MFLFPKVTQSTRKVEIQPNYTALSGKLVSDTALSGEKDTDDKLNKDDILVLEDQLENLFDYEPDEPDEDDDEIAFIEEVKVDPEVAKKKKEVYTLSFLRLFFIIFKLSISFVLRFTSKISATFL